MLLKISFNFCRHELRFVPFLVNQSATRIDNFLRNIHRYDSLEIEKGCSRSNMVRQEDGHTNQSLDNIHKDQVPSPANIFQNSLDIYMHNKRQKMSKNISR